MSLSKRYNLAPFELRIRERLDALPTRIVTQNEGERIRITNRLQRAEDELERAAFLIKEILNR